VYGTIAYRTGASVFSVKNYGNMAKILKFQFVYKDLKFDAPFIKNTSQEVQSLLLKNDQMLSQSNLHPLKPNDYFF
jgi:hypothetical protein